MHIILALAQPELSSGCLEPVAGAVMSEPLISQRLSKYTHESIRSLQRDTLKLHAFAELQVLQNGCGTSMLVGDPFSPLTALLTDASIDSCADNI